MTGDILFHSLTERIMTYSISSTKTARNRICHKINFSIKGLEDTLSSMTPARGDPALFKLIDWFKDHSVSLYLRPQWSYLKNSASHTM